MEEKRMMEFKNRFTTIVKGEFTFNQARKMGLDLAKEHNAPISLFVFNDRLGHWQRMDLTYCPDGFAYDDKGIKYYLDADGRNFWRVKE